MQRWSLERRLSIADASRFVFKLSQPSGGRKERSNEQASSHPNRWFVHAAATGLCGTTTFANGEHQIVDGKGNLVIDTGTNPPVVRVDDPTDRLLATATIVVESNGTLIPGAFHTGTLPGTPPTPGTQIQDRFEKTGRYLVVCMNRNHYLNDWMFGFIDVVDAGGTNP